VPPVALMARPKPAPPSTPDDIEAQFYEALQRGDIERLMAVWSDDDDICCVHPGGPRLVGAVAIRASFDAMFGNGAIDARPEKVRRLQTHACAVHSVLEQVRVIGPEGVATAWVVATNVYLQTAQGWRLVAHHASPGTAAAVQDIVETASILH
jgi:ketosteroid isomerase-like protein